MTTVSKAKIILKRTKFKDTYGYHYVYLITNLVNGKKYVGDHTTKRLADTYLGSGTLLWIDLRKYGRGAFKREILEFFSTRLEAHLAEMKYIKKYNTQYPDGYNQSPTGGTTHKGFHSEETKQKIRTQVYQYDWYGNFIASYSGICIAMKQVFGKRGPYKIRECCLGKSVSVGGYYWSFKETERYIPVNSTVISRYDSKGIYLNSYKSRNDAALQTGINEKRIGACILGKGKLGGGFIWKQGIPLNN